MHARKFVAALQAASASGHPILLKVLAHSGHLSSDQLAAQIEETTERISFLKKELSL
jgi:prolyl oligopeptidase